MDDISKLIFDRPLGDAPSLTIAWEFVRGLSSVAAVEFPDIADLFPFRARYDAFSQVDSDWVAARIRSHADQGTPTCGQLTHEDIAELRSKLLPFRPRPPSEYAAMLGPKWFAHDRFTFVGSIHGHRYSSSDLKEQAIAWLNAYVGPRVLQLNQARVARVIPPPPSLLAAHPGVSM